MPAFQPSRKATGRKRPSSSVAGHPRAHQNSSTSRRLLRERRRPHVARPRSRPSRLGGMRFPQRVRTVYSGGSRRATSTRASLHPRAGRLRIARCDRTREMSGCFGRLSILGCRRRKPMRSSAGTLRSRRESFRHGRRLERQRADRIPRAERLGRTYRTRSRLGRRQARTRTMQDYPAGRRRRCSATIQRSEHGRRRWLEITRTATRRRTCPRMAISAGLPPETRRATPDN